MSRADRRREVAQKVARIRDARAELYRQWCVVRREHGKSTTRAAFDADAREQLGEIQQELRQEAAQAKARAARAPKVRRIQIAIVVALTALVCGGCAGLVWWLR